MMDKSPECFVFALVCLGSSGPKINIADADGKPISRRRKSTRYHAAGSRGSRLPRKGARFLVDEWRRMILSELHCRALFSSQQTPSSHTPASEALALPLIRSRTVSKRPDSPSISERPSKRRRKHGHLWKRRGAFAQLSVSHPPGPSHVESPCLDGLAQRVRYDDVD